MRLYMKTTTDRYELPIAVAESVNELSRMLNMPKASVATMVCKQICGYHKLDVPDDKWPDNDGGLWWYDEHGQVVHEH